MHHKAQAHLERPVNFTTAAKKVAQLRGHYSRQGGWIYDSNGKPICQGWDYYASRLYDAGVIAQDAEHNGGNGKYFVNIFVLRASELRKAEELWGEQPALTTHEQRDEVITKALGIAPGETLRIDLPEDEVSVGCGDNLDVYDPTPEDDDELLDEVYGVDRDYPCKHGHLDCATSEGGACANETYANRLAARQAGRQDHQRALELRGSALRDRTDREGRRLEDVADVEHERGVGPDVFVQYEGTIGIVYGKTEKGADWLAAHLDPEAMRWGGGYVVEHRYLGYILNGALEAGLRIGGS